MDRPLGVPQTQQAAVSGFFSRVYMWMAGGLFLSAFGAFMALSNPAILRSLVTPQGRPSMFYWGLCIAEIALVVLLSARIGKLTATSAGGIFALYSLLNGVTLSLIFLVYTASSISTTFAITAGTFLFFSVYGFVTKQDLSSVGNIGKMAVIGIILATLVNMLIKSTAIDYIITYIGIATFIGLTAADTQKLKQMMANADSRDWASKLAIVGALQLYLDFINLFLFLLRLFGRQRN